MQVINRSPGDPEPVFDAILEKARVLCGAEMGTPSEMGRRVRRRRSGQAWVSGHCFAAMLGTRRTAFPSWPWTCAVPRGERFSHILDATEVEVQPGEDDGVRALIEQSGTRTWLYDAMRRDGALIGFINVARAVVRAFLTGRDCHAGKPRRPGGDRDGECPADWGSCANAQAN